MRTLGAAPTTNAHLGFWVQGVSIATTTSATPNTIQSISLVPGNWIIFGDAFFQNGVTFASLSISATNNSNDTFFQVAGQSVGGSPVLNISRGVPLTNTTPFYLVAQANTAANVSSIMFYAIRIG